MRLCIFSFLCFSVLLLQGQVMPDYEAVMKKIYKEYNTEQFRDCKLMKKPDGWWFAKVEYSEEGERLVNPRLFWSKKTGGYLPLNYDRREEVLQDDSQLYEYGYRLEDTYNYERCAYYGYDDWSADVIKDFQNKENLTNRELESLSRAYGAYATAFLGYRQWRYTANKNGSYRDETTISVLPKNRMDSFFKYSELEIQTIQKIINNDAYYEVMVGHIRHKLANEYMYVCHQLLMSGHPEEAQKFLHRANYDNLNLSVAKNFLNGLPHNAILFTDSDNDTYPVWYLQQAQNYRRDVCVINLSLLMSASYVNKISSPQSPLGCVKLNIRNFVADSLLHRDKYLFNNFYGVPVNIDADSLLKKIYQQSEPIMTLKIDNVILRHNGDSAVYLAKNSKYLHLSNFCQWEIYNSNNRPVFYSFWGVEEFNQYRYLTRNGFNYQLGKGKGEENIITDSAALTNWWFNDFSSLLPDNLNPGYSSKSLSVIYKEYYSSLSAAIRYQSNKKEAVKTSKLIELGMNLYPDHELHYNPGLGIFISAIATTAEKNRVKSLLPRYLEMCKQEHRKYVESLKTNSNYDSRNYLNSKIKEVEMLEKEPALKEYFPLIEQCIRELQNMK